MKKALAILALLLLIAPAIAQNETDNSTMEPGNETMEQTDSSSSAPADNGEGGNKTVVWIIVIVALAGLLYAYGRLKKTE